jgi:hypothetical protein
MAVVIKHPKFEQAAAAPLRRLEKSFEGDRERAIATLGDAVTMLEKLWERCGAPELRTMAAEYGVFLKALKSIDPRCVDDGLQEQLQHIQDRLLRGHKTLEKYNVPARSAKGDNHGQ